jgi:CheY-like chemotaxis protein
MAAEASLNFLGYNSIKRALNGKEAFEKTHNNRFNLIITDNIMPFMTGLELAKAIRDKEHACGGGRDMRIMLLTGEDISRMTNDSCQLFDGILQKPINMNKLAAKLKELNLGQ